MKPSQLLKFSSLILFVSLLSACAQSPSSSPGYDEIAPDQNSSSEVASELTPDQYDIFERLQAAGDIEWFEDKFGNLTDIPVENIYLTDSDSQGNGCAVWVFADKATVEYQVEVGNFDWMSDEHWWWYGTDDTTGKGIILASNLESGDCATQADSAFGW
jgi:hypothetical protein